MEDYKTEWSTEWRSLLWKQWHKKKAPLTFIVEVLHCSMTMPSSLTIMDGTTENYIELCWLPRDLYYLASYQLCRVSHKSHFPSTHELHLLHWKYWPHITWIFCCFKDILIQPTSSSCILQPFSMIYLFALDPYCPSCCVHYNNKECNFHCL